MILGYVLGKKGEAIESWGFQKSGLQCQPRQVLLWALESL